MRFFGIDLCCGLGGASAAWKARGWDVLTLDADPRFAADVTADVRAWSYRGPRPLLAWASPPCTEFSRSILPWIRDPKAPDMSILEGCLRVIRECDPVFWCLENVRGAVRWLAPLLGPPRRSHGPFFLWGNYPAFRCRVPPFKERLSSARRAERAMVPYQLSDRLAAACERSLEAVVYSSTGE